MWKSWCAPRQSRANGDACTSPRHRAAHFGRPRGFAIRDHQIHALDGEVGERNDHDSDGVRFLGGNFWRQKARHRNHSLAVEYHNGEQRGQNPLSGYGGSGNRSWYLGATYGGQTFQGSLDDFRLYSRVLSQAEITQLQNEGVR